jgi:hypothetical protein
MWIAFAFTCPSSRIGNSRRIYSYFTTNWHYMGLLLLYYNAIYFSTTMRSWHVLTDKPTCNNRKHELFLFNTQTSICKFEVTEENNAIRLCSKPSTIQGMEQV